MKHIFASISFFILLLASCKKEDWEEVPPSELPSRLEGVWQSEGYGYILEIKSGKATLFDVTKISGIKRTNLFDGAGADVSQWKVQMKEKNEEFIYFSKNSIIEYRFNKLSQLPDICKDGGTPASQDPLLNFDILWQTFKENYAFFDLRKVNWDELKARYRPQVNAGNLESILQQMLYHLNEDHVTLSTTSDDFIHRFDAGAKRTFARFYAEKPSAITQPELKAYVVSEYEKIVGNILTNYLKGDFETAANQQLFWGKLDPKIGYLLIGQMSGYSVEELKLGLNKALEDLKDTEGLVIDIRGNLGGNDRIILEAAGRFINNAQVGWRFNARNEDGYTDLQTVLLQPTGTMRYTKPVRILTSLATSSAAEIFTLMLKQNSYVKVVGETTNGIYSTMLNKRLPNGWQFSLSNEILYDANGKRYETIGITPDITAPFPSVANRNNGIDPALDQYKTWF